MAYRYYDLVEQTSTTEGTGGYVMSGSVDGRRDFSVVTNGHLVPYVAVDGAGGFEYGVGTWNSGTSTLARTLVLGSSNAGAAVNWAAGTRNVYISPHSTFMGLATVRHNIGLTSSIPASGDDANDGYGIGSLWVTTSNAAYVCADATAGAAIWLRVLLADIANGSVSVRDLCLDFQGPSDITLRPGAGMVAGTGAARHVSGWLEETTTDDTPTPLLDIIQGVALDISELNTFPNHGALFFEAKVVAASATDRKVWKVMIGGESTTGSFTFGTADITELHATAGAAGWDIAVDSAGTPVRLRLMGTGDTTDDVNWFASYEFIFGLAAA